jgi:hypothetical protein
MFGLILLTYATAVFSLTPNATIGDVRLSLPYGGLVQSDFIASTEVAEQRFTCFVPPHVPAIHIVLRVSNHWESYFRLHVWKDTGDDDSAATTARFEVQKTCSDLFDECVQSRDFSYSLPTHIPQNLRPKFRGRLVARIDSPISGIWSLAVKNGLPHDATAQVQIEITASSQSFWIGLCKGTVMVVAFAFAASIFFAFIAFKSYEARQEVNRISEESIDEILTAVVLNVRAASLRYFSSLARREELTGTDDDRHEESEEDDNAPTCRICRSRHPESSLFSPCACSGSVQFVHRECLDEWRDKTQNPEHRERCAECKTAYTYETLPGNPHSQFARLQTVGLARKLGKLVVFSVVFVMLGYVLKVVAFIVTIDTDIRWTVDVYHYLIGLTIFAALIVHYVVIMPYLQVWPVLTQYLIVFCSLAFEIGAGYVGQFMLWTINDTLWTQQVSFGVGFFVILLCIVYFLPFLREAIENFLSSRERVGAREGTSEEAVTVVRHRVEETSGEQEEEMQPM